MIDKPFTLFVVTTLIVAWLTGCTRGVHGGDPALPLSNTNGTTQVFHTSESVVLTAITNAFSRIGDDPMDYRGMRLYPAADKSYLVPNWHPTNGFVLSPHFGPKWSIAYIPLQGRAQISVPYKASFYVTTKSVNSSNLSVSVRTLYAKVSDGEEIGVHGGWANHARDVPPVRLVEEEILVAISNAVVAVKGGDKVQP